MIISFIKLFVVIEICGICKLFVINCSIWIKNWIKIFDLVTLKIFYESKNYDDSKCRLKDLSLQKNSNKPTLLKQVCGDNHKI